MKRNPLIPPQPLPLSKVIQTKIRSISSRTITVTGTTGNTLSQTAPSATDDVIQIVGVATHADRMFFNPSLVQVEHT